MRSSLLISLVFCEGLLSTPRVAAAAKDPPSTTNAGPGRRPGSAVSHQGTRVSVLRRDGNLSGSGALGRGRPSATATSKVAAKDEAGTARAGDEPSKSALSSVAPSVQTHRVKRGETLGTIATRYDTAEPVLVALNGLSDDDAIQAGQILFVPGRDKPPAAHAESSSSAWRRYAKPPKEKGYVELSTHTTRFVGLVVDKAGRLRPAAVRAINEALGAGGKHPPLPERLIRLLVKVSDEFGGRSIHAVSGYRTTSYYQDSRHRLSAAVDFAIADVPNAILCEYLRELDDVGVGYYPNSTFVHLDVRGQSAYWVDYAGPGQPPRSSPNAPRPTRGTKRWLLAEIDALVEHTKKSLQRDERESPLDVPTPTPPKLKSTSTDEGPQPAALDEPIASSRDSQAPVSL